MWGFSLGTPRILRQCRISVGNAVVLLALEAWLWNVPSLKPGPCLISMICVSQSLHGMWAYTELIQWSRTSS